MFNIDVDTDADVNTDKSFATICFNRTLINQFILKTMMNNNNSHV